MIRATQAHIQNLETERLQWAREGLLIKSTQFGRAWGESHHAIAEACRRNELFRLKIGNFWFYPAVFERFSPGDVHRINSALKGDDSVGKFIFWNRTHGGLGGRNICEALQYGMLDRVLELASGWSEERGWDP